MDAWQRVQSSSSDCPWWFTSDPTRGIGFRIIRPLAEPASRDAKERYWAIDDDDTRDGVDNRMSEGRGGRGLVDPDLPEAIKNLKARR